MTDHRPAQVKSILKRRRWSLHCDDDGKFFVDGSDREGRGGHDGNDLTPGVFYQWLNGRTWSCPWQAVIQTEKAFIRLGGM